MRLARLARRLRETTDFVATACFYVGRVSSLTRTQLLVAAAVGALAVFSVTLGLLVLSGRSHHASVAVGVKLPQAAQVHTLLAGIPQHGLTLGSEAAPVKLVEYYDLQCPYCRMFTMNDAPTLIARYVRTGKVLYEAVPLAFVGDDSVRGRDALVAASMQNHAFDFETLLYENQGVENSGWLSDEMIGAAARSIRGLDVGQLMSDRGHADTAPFDARAKADGITGTPTFVIEKNGTKTVLVNPSASVLFAAL